MYFNPRSRERNDWTELQGIVDQNDFNPRSRERNDRRKGGKDTGSPISIHVPARGTTSLCAPYGTLVNISIHVPARGTTGI